jgi:hypothetical protein
MTLESSLSPPRRTHRSVLFTLAAAAAGALVLAASPSFAGDRHHGRGGHPGYNHGHHKQYRHYSKPHHRPHFSYYSAPRYYAPAYYYAPPVYYAPRPVAYVQPAPVYYEQPRSYLSVSW